MLEATLGPSLGHFPSEGVRDPMAESVARVRVLEIDRARLRVPGPCLVVVRAVSLSGEALRALVSGLAELRSDVRLLGVGEADWRWRGVSVPRVSLAATEEALAAGATVLWIAQAGSELNELGAATVRQGACWLPVSLAPAAGEGWVARVGAPLSSQVVNRLEESGDLWGHLGWRFHGIEQGRSTAASGETVTQSMAPVVEAAPASELEAEVEALSASHRLIDRGEHLVALARAAEIPALLREIGRLREITFRSVGEGTGAALDLDRFDESYLHLFVWSRRERCLLGAFRLGPTDRLVEGGGVGALYTSTLFNYGPRLPAVLSPALELGRSFVRPEAQRGSKTLLLLWWGIGAFVARHPKYSTLFGPVSISALYQDFSRDLMVRVFSRGGFLHPASEQVAPRHPVPYRDWSELSGGQPLRGVASLELLSAVVSDAEADGKGVPLLVREYLKLGGQFLSFNVDPDFAGVIDGLVVVDLLKTDRRLLKFYMSAEGLKAFEGQLGRRLPD